MIQNRMLILNPLLKRLRSSEGAVAQWTPADDTTELDSLKVSKNLMNLSWSCALSLG